MGVARVVAVVLVAVALAACGESQPRASRAAGGARVLAERQVAPGIVDLTIRSPALGSTAKVRLLTPDGWASRTPGRRWPVLYLLHGCCDTYDSWTRSTDVEALPNLRHVLVVMPEAGAVGFYSNWRDGPGWETFHVDELRALLQRRYGAGDRRAIAGLSMGGLGAMDYAARHPGLFRAAASYSGTLHPLEDPRWTLGLFSAHTSDPRAVWGDPSAQRSTWAAHDPTELASRLRGTTLYVASGNGERGGKHDAIEATVYRESRAFVARLHQLHIPVQADFYGPGVHDWPYWQRDLRRSLSLLLAAIGAAA